jgi:hypothetical protein
MNKARITFSLLILFFGLTCLSYSQTESEGLMQKINFGAGVGLEYFSRTVSWDDDTQKSSMPAFLITLNVEAEFTDGFTLGIMVGYISSKFNEMVFRELPISIEYDAGAIGGFALGAEAKYSFFNSYDFAISAIGQLLYYSGGTKEWDIPGLNVEGRARGKPKWIKPVIGLSFEYKGMDYFYPYLNVAFSPLSGSFKMDETIDSLTGTEKKDFSGKSKFMLGLGGLYELTDSVGITAEIDLMPYSGKEDYYDGGLDFGFMVRVRYQF